MQLELTYFNMNNLQKSVSRKQFLKQFGLASSSVFLFNNFVYGFSKINGLFSSDVDLDNILEQDDIFTYINRVKGKFDLTLYRQIVGAANRFKEGDQLIGVAAANEVSRINAQKLLANTKIKDIDSNYLFQDEQLTLIQQTTQPNKELQEWTMKELKSFVLNKSETEIKQIMPSLSSDVIACLVKLLSNQELITIGQKVFNPLPNSKIGSKGYLSARVQPNSPTDNTEDISWQVFNAWSFAVGDLMLGTNPVSSDTQSVATIEKTLFEIIKTFKLENTLPNCVLSHIDIQAQAEEINPGSTGIWFQSIASSVAANNTFDVSIEKMFKHVKKRKGKYGLYAETGQGADATNGHSFGVDMVIHEARKYGFVRALKTNLSEGKTTNEIPWVVVNDVAGFIGPEVFRTKEQLVRCCLEDIAMGKLHGLTIGLDICSTLHMDVSMDDLDWCIANIMPANPAYLMALPTKNDPMLSYLTTAFSDHIKIREQFNYKVNDAMWDFFKKIQIIDENNKPTSHFGDPIWVYYQYCLSKNDARSKEEIYTEGNTALQRVKERGVAIAQGHGKNYWDLEPNLENEVRKMYEDAKVCLWATMPAHFPATIPKVLPLITQSENRKDYVYHPSTGEKLSPESAKALLKIKNQSHDFQIVISDGLSIKSITDDGHLMPFINELNQLMKSENYNLSRQNILITHGRVRAGYQCGEILFGNNDDKNPKKKVLIHIIGERPGTLHHCYSVYITAASANIWGQTGKVDHNITRVVSGISDTSLHPNLASKEVFKICKEMIG